MVKINLGCGMQIVDGWINVDYSIGARLAKIPLFPALNRKLGLFSANWDKRIFLHDLRKPFPWKDATVDVIYSSHTLEHFTRSDGLRVLQESFRVLKPGGVIRILVPDLAVNVAHYLNGKTRADRFFEGLEILYSQRKGWFKQLFAPVIEFPHKCYYDAPTLITILDEIGFDATSMGAFESRIDDIGKIEISDRTVHAVVAEGVKRDAVRAGATAAAAEVTCPTP